MATVLGIDEAGRGPVIGPLVMAGVLMDEHELPVLQKMGVKDSKLLLPKKREQLFEALVNIVKGYRVLIIQPAEIDHVISEASHLNLNLLEAEKSAVIINEFKPDKAILDCPSPNNLAYVSYVRERLQKKGVTLLGEHKADVNYPIVGAASILAKVIRDREIEAIKQRIGHDFGSGYLTDEQTTAFLKSHWHKHKEIFRTSWAPYKKLVEGRAQQQLSSF